jgi:hypothetical protein
MISRHLRNVFDEGELIAASVVADIATPLIAPLGGFIGVVAPLLAWRRREGAKTRGPPLATDAGQRVESGRRRASAR